MKRVLIVAVVAAVLANLTAVLAEEPPAVVANVKVVSDKVKDVSNLEAWKKAYIKDGMTDKEKALAIWECMVGHQHQDSPPCEYINNEGTVQDALKMMNVYGYSFCGVVANEITSLARYVGVEARVSTINTHVVPELKWDGKWHLLDASLINYFPKPDGDLASIEEIMAAVKEWYDKNPDYLVQPKDPKGKPTGDNAKLSAFHQADGWTGWKKGPDLLAKSPWYGEDGWLSAHTHGWYSTMQEYDGSTYFPYEGGYSLGYRVNVQLRPGEKLVRNWSNKGLTVNSDMGNVPGCINMKVGEGNMAYTPKFGDKAVGRVGNGLREYDVQLADATLPKSATKFDNLVATAGGKPVLACKQADQQGVLDVAMPSSFPAIKGEIALDAVLADGGEIKVLFSDNNGLDFKPVATIDKSGEQKIDFSKVVVRRYNYIIRVVMKGQGTGLNALKISNIIQHSQRPLPVLEQGENTITFSAGPQEGTVTVEPSMNPQVTGDKNLTWKDFHPVVNNLSENTLMVDMAKGTGDITYKVDVPNDLTWLTIMTHYRARDKKGLWDVQVSYDDGKTFASVGKCEGPTAATGKFIEIKKDIPAGVKTVYVRWSGTANNNATLLFNTRIDAHYKLPSAGFRPVKVTYLWEEGGIEKKDEHVAKQADETYKIKCDGKPLMKSITMELVK